MSRFVLVLVLGMALLVMSCSKDTIATPPVQLNQLQAALDSVLHAMDNDLAEGAISLKSTGCEGDMCRTILQHILSERPYVVDAASLSSPGILTVVEPAEYRKFEGTDVSSQEHIKRLFEEGMPVMSKAFIAAGGYKVVDIHYPVKGNNEEIRGALNLQIDPDKLFGHIFESILAKVDAEGWLIQKDGLFLYETDAEEVGKNLFKDPLYSSEEIQKLSHKIINDSEGAMGYTFSSRGMGKPVAKIAWWKTVELYGTEWRVGVSKEI